MQGGPSRGWGAAICSGGLGPGFARDVGFLSAGPAKSLGKVQATPVDRRRGGAEEGSGVGSDLGSRESAVLGCSCPRS